jgi:glutamate/tyrosine decarboxylase-like PLP-dependent enzyme
MVLAQGIEHFSFAGAARALGLGAKGILWAGSNGDYTTNVESVEAALDQAPPDVEPFMVVSVAGNCRTTAIDEIARMRKVCDQRGLWLHVDACHGGCLLLSERHRKRLHGIETADSVSLDPHKGFFITYPASYVLFRDPHALGALSRYPGQSQDPNCMDLGLITPFFGSRGFQSLKLWLLIKHLGLKQLGRIVDYRQVLNGVLTRELEATGLFALLHDNTFYRQAFVFCPAEVLSAIPGLLARGKDPADLRDLISHKTRLFSDRLYRSGRAVFDLFSLQDLNNVLHLGTQAKYSVMGMALGQPAMPENVLREIRAAIVEFGEPLRAEMAEELFGHMETRMQAAGVRVDSPAGW